MGRGGIGGQPPQRGDITLSSLTRKGCIAIVFILLLSGVGKELGDRKAGGQRQCDDKDEAEEASECLQACCGDVLLLRFGGSALNSKDSNVVEEQI